jgi:two-component system, chemotaxis family, protein-glutamate methylesterase/glutaminase
MINATSQCRDIIVIGTSAGGVTALSELFARLPGDLPAAVAVVIHLSPLYPSRLPSILARVAALTVLPASDGAVFERGTAYVSVPDRHLVLSEHAIRLTREPKEHFARPAIDPLFRSAATHYGDVTRAVAVLLSGAGTDGVVGATAIKSAGGMVLVQKPVAGGTSEHAACRDPSRRSRRCPLPRAAGANTAQACCRGSRGALVGGGGSCQGRRLSS